MDHDQRFKTLIREFFADFLQLFFADIARNLDLSDPEWLDKELYPDPPEGTRHAIDLVAQVPVTVPIDDGSKASIILVHIEVDASDKTTILKPRFPFYYHFLRDKLNLPVLPIAIFLKVGLDGIGIDHYEEKVWDLTPLTFEYLYVGLPGLDGVEYLQKDNWLSVALSALMKIPRDRVAWLGAEALRRLVGAPLSDQKRFLLGECVQAYLSMDEQQQQEYEDLMMTETYKEALQMNQTVYEKGLEKGTEIGLEKGAEIGRRRMMAELLEDSFGPLSQATMQQLDQLSINELRELSRKIRTAQSLADLGLPEGDESNP